MVLGHRHGIGPALAAIEQLSDYAVDRQQVISVLVRNLSRVSDQIGGGSGNAMALIKQLTILFLQLKDKVPLLAQFADEIPPILFPLENSAQRCSASPATPTPTSTASSRRPPQPGGNHRIAGNRLPDFFAVPGRGHPGGGQVHVLQGRRHPPAALTVLLGKQRITLRQA